MKHPRLAILIVALSLGACGIAPPKPDPVVPEPAVQEKTQVNVDPTLLLDCPTVPLLPTDHEITKAEAVQEIEIMAGVLSTCWHRHHDLSALASSAFNIAQPAVPASGTATSK
jgi:hypothetical protein